LPSPRCVRRPTLRRIKYKEFAKFDSAAIAVEEASGILEGKVTPKLASLLNELKDEKKVTLAVHDTKLSNSITKLPGINIKPISGSMTDDLFRAIRQHLYNLIPGMEPSNFDEMNLGLAHSLSRHKLKFSPEKVDVMIVHAVALLDELDKELNVMAMRVKEWYGWHFPELGKILPDNLSYARVVLALGLRTNAPNADLSEILPPEIEAAVKAAADISMGTEISTEDYENIKLLAVQVVERSEYRRQLAEYLQNRMKAISPNMTELIGALVGARLIAHSGSLVNLAKNPGSTIQILGAEKALFRALKTKHATPKYGIIYHASLVGQASGPNKGKIARQLAAKIALSVRTDAFEDFPENADDETRAAVGIQARAKLENNLRLLEGKPLNKGVALGPNGIPVGMPAKWDVKEARKYNIEADGLATTTSKESSEQPKRPLIEEVPEVEMKDASASDKKDKKEKKKEKKEVASSKITEADYERIAKELGMSLSKFTKKLEKGKIKIKPDGSVEVKGKDGEDAEAETPVKSKSSKRKHEPEEETPAKEEKHKKKKKKSSKE